MPVFLHAKAAADVEAVPLVTRQRDDKDEGKAPRTVWVWVEGEPSQAIPVLRPLEQAPTACRCRMENCGSLFLPAE